MNKLQKLARKFAQMVESPPPVDSALPGPPNQGPEDDEAVLEKAMDKLNIPAKHKELIRGGSYHLVPYLVMSDLEKVLQYSNHFKREIFNYLLETFHKLIDANGDVVSNPQEIMRVQQALLNKGQSLGTFGTNKNGVDGKWGSWSSNALWRFQSKNRLETTATLTAETSQALGI